MRLKSGKGAGYADDGSTSICSNAKAGSHVCEAAFVGTRVGRRTDWSFSSARLCKKEKSKSEWYVDTAGKATNALTSVYLDTAASALWSLRLWH